MIQSSRHTIKGIQRDLSVSKFNPEYAFDAHNIRLTAINDSTLLSVTNEKGNKEVDNITIKGVVLGYCVINRYLTVFTKGDKDYIYLIYKGETFNSKVLYAGDLGFSTEYPIETLGVYENENIQKVYWIDGKNQPRVINIVAERGYNDGSFDFVQSLKLNEKVSIETIKTSNGNFNAGVIQYAFSYYNNHLQESNIFYTSPIYYISHPDRGANPEERVNTSFSINITNLDDFDYVRVYSIHRTSLNATPTVSKVQDLAIGEDRKISYIDTGSDGEIIDATELLYIGGESIIANTMTSKDNTLFLGDITLTKPAINKNIATSLQKGTIIDRNKAVPVTKNKGSYYESINPINIPSFKTGEHYRLGIQFQYKNGKWSEPIHLKDYIIPSSNKPLVTENTLSLPAIEYQYDNSVAEQLKKEGFVKARPVVVFPSFNDRLVLTQGMLCPTVFNAGNRLIGAPHSQSSWFLRPRVNTGIYSGNNQYIDNGAHVEFRHLHSLYSKDDRGAEIQNILESPDFIDVNNEVIRGENSSYENTFLVDTSIVTLHSPDVEFDDDFATINNENYKLRIVGLINFTANSGDIDIQTNTPPISPRATGFYHKSLAGTDGFRSLVAGQFYRDYLVDDMKDGSFEADSTEHNEYGILVYPWQKSGSINNDAKRPNGKGTRSAELKTKKISNLKFSKDNTWLPSVWTDNINPVSYFGSDDVTLVKVPIGDTTFNYYGNIDTILLAKEEYSILYGHNNKASFYDTSFDEITKDKHFGDNNDIIVSSKESVRMKYKSSPHLVFSLSSNNGVQSILPTINNIQEISDDIKYSTPYWIDSSVADTSDYKGVQFFQDEEPSLRAAEGSLWVETADHIDNYYKLNKVIIKGSSQEAGAVKEWEEVTITADDKYYYDDGAKRLYFVAVKPAGYNHYVLKKTNLKESDSPYIKQDNITVDAEYPYLFLAELYKDNVVNAFGDIKNNVWLPAGEPANIGGAITFSYGDTWYQRYDCLKTYPFSSDDENQIIEIASFMCETRVNLDGRYDRNKGLMSNLNISPTNFNLINKVYSQQNNYFNYKVLEDDFKELDDFHNTITWSKEKTNSEDVDTWTNFNLLSTLDLDGDKGKVVSLNTFNSNILCFQETGISNILFNSRVQVPTSDGTNIEITNGFKVDGKRYITESVGCNNKWSIKEAQSGIFFVDDKTKSIYSCSNEGVVNISTTLGFNSWLIKQDTSIWNPSDFKGFVTYYDNKNKDIYFTNKETALVYSESLKQFTSFMDYNEVPAMFNVGSGFYSIKNGKLWEHFAGDYNYFYNKFRPFSITYISNSNEPYDKVFNTVEYRADFWDDDTLTNNTFDTLEVWNEYQKGIAELSFRKNKVSNLKKKFRIWNANIPRDMNSRRDRIRNTWAFVKLSKNKENTNRMELHDVAVEYFI